MIGKYSPTVSQKYQANQKWFSNNCLVPGDLYDIDGFDMYGYNKNGFDRDGHDEWYYFNQALADDSYD